MKKKNGSFSNIYLPVNTFSYPGDTETFGHGVRLTDHLGMKVIGVWH